MRKTKVPRLVDGQMDTTTKANKLKTCKHKNEMIGGWDMLLISIILKTIIPLCTGC